MRRRKKKRSFIFKFILNKCINVSGIIWFGYLVANVFISAFIDSYIISLTLTFIYKRVLKKKKLPSYINNFNDRKRILKIAQRYISIVIEDRSNSDGIGPTASIVLLSIFDNEGGENISLVIVSRLLCLRIGSQHFKLDIQEPISG